MHSNKASLRGGAPQGSVHCSFYLYQRKRLLYVDDIFLIFQHNDTKTIADHLNQDFSTLVDCFVDNKLRVYLGGSVCDRTCLKRIYMSSITNSLSHAN